MVQCKAYDAPPCDGRYITTIAPQSTLGPVENYYYDETTRLVAICVRGYWINVWGVDKRGCGVHYAYRVPEDEVQQWRRWGWRD